MKAGVNKTYENKNRSSSNNLKKAIPSKIIDSLLNYQKSYGFVSQKQILDIAYKYFGTKKISNTDKRNFHKALENHHVKIKYNVLDKKNVRKKYFINIISFVINHSSIQFTKELKEKLEIHGPITLDRNSNKYFTTSGTALKKIHQDIKSLITTGKKIKTANSSLIKVKVNSSEEKSKSTKTEVTIKKQELEKYFRSSPRVSSHEGINIADNENDFKWVDNFLNYSPNITSKQELEAVIGFDFGTTSTKVIVNFPYHADLLGYNYIVFPVPKAFQSNNHDYLWKTILYYNPELDLYSLYPNKGYHELNDIKTNLMNNPYEIIKKFQKVNIYSIHASVAFISMLLKIIKAYCYELTKEKKFFKSLTRKINWSLNLGMPAAKLDDTEEKRTYQRIAKLSLNLESITFSNKAIDSMIKNNISHSLENVIEVNVLPEITAAVSGIYESMMLDAGEYFFIDIGGSTIDLSVINIFLNDTGNKQISNLISKVHILGAEALDWIKNQNADYDRDDLFNAICKVLGNIIGDNKKFRNPSSPSLGDSLKTFIIGGGRQSEVHKHAIDAMERNWKNNFYPNGLDRTIFKLEKSKFSKEYNIKNDEMRLSVAFGLSLPSHEVYYVKPSAIEDIIEKKQKVKDWKFAADK